MYKGSFDLFASLPGSHWEEGKKLRFCPRIGGWLHVIVRSSEGRVDVALA